MKRTTSILLLASASLAAACSQAPSDTANAQIEQATTDPAKALPIRTTIKPGAAISFKHSDLVSVEPGENGRVTVVLSEPYEQGQLVVTANASDGLEVFGAERSMRFDLSSDTPHEMTIEYRATQPGDYRIGFAARVELDGGFRMGRAYAVPVRIGSGGDMTAAQKGSVQTDLTGERRVVFQAVETIR